MAPIKCIGLGLYKYEDEGDFFNLLIQNFYDEEDIYIQFIDVID